MNPSIELGEDQPAKLISRELLEAGVNVKSEFCIRDVASNLYVGIDDKKVSVKTVVFSRRSRFSSREAAEKAIPIILRNLKNSFLVIEEIFFLGN